MGATPYPTKQVYRHKLSRGRAHSGWAYVREFYVFDVPVLGTSRIFVQIARRPERYRLDTDRALKPWKDSFSFYAYYADSHMPHISASRRCTPDEDNWLEEVEGEGKGEGKAGGGGASSTSIGGRRALVDAGEDGVDGVGGVGGGGETKGGTKAVRFGEADQKAVNPLHQWLQGANAENGEDDDDPRIQLDHG